MTDVQRLLERLSSAADRTLEKIARDYWRNWKAGDGEVYLELHFGVVEILTDRRVRGLIVD